MSSTPDKIKIGTRSSKLAITQTEEIVSILKKHSPDNQIEIIQIKTSGDKIQDRNLSDIGGKGLFIKELEEALIKGKIDIAVHSAKDVPPTLHEETELLAFSQRLDQRDAFISSKYDSLSELPKGSIIGTSSARRKSILLNLRPDLKIVNFRGNVNTRLKKLDDGEVDATILAVCGLERLNKVRRIKEIIPTNLMLPSGGQGALAIQTRKNDKEILKIVKKINHKPTQIRIKTERSFLRELCASCATPVSAFATIEGDKLSLKTMILDYDGSQIFKTSSSCKIDLKEGIELGITAANKTKTEAGELLSKICK